MFSFICFHQPALFSVYTMDFVSAGKNILLLLLFLLLFLLLLLSLSLLLLYYVQCVSLQFFYLNFKYFSNRIKCGDRKFTFGI